MWSEITLGGAVARGRGGARLLRRWRSALRVISSPPELGGEPGRAGWSERAHRPPRVSLLKKWSRRGSH